LGVARQVVEVHGGYISVASILGQGSVFTLSLPRLGVASEGAVSAVEGQNHDQDRASA
jgi:signal transduction histidine kinase